MNNIRCCSFLFLLAFATIFFLSAPAGASEKESAPAPVARVLNEAYTLLGKKRPDEAVKHLSDFLEKGRDHHLIRFAIGNCHMSANRPDKARDQYLTAIGLSPEYGPAWFNLANSYYELKNYAKAGEAYTGAYNHSEDQKAEALYYAGASFLTAGRPSEALSSFDGLLATHRNEIQPQWWTTYVHILLALKKNDRALPVIAELVETSSGAERKQWQEVLLYQYIALKKNRQALVYADALARENPLEPKWWKGLAHLHLTENRHREALAAMIVYSYLVDLSDEEKKLLADLFASVNIFSQSALLLEELLLKKWDSRIVVQLAQNCLSRHKPSLALGWADKGLKRDEQNKDLLLLKGNILFVMKAYPESAGAFAAATRIDGTLGSAWLMLGYASRQAEDFSTARKAFQKAASFPAQQKAAIEALRSLKKMDPVH